MGGSTGTGITSGLDRPGYRQGTTVGNTFFPYGEGDRVSQGALDMINAFPNRMNAMKQPTAAADRDHLTETFLLYRKQLSL